MIFQGEGGSGPPDASPLDAHMCHFKIFSSDDRDVKQSRAVLCNIHAQMQRTGTGENHKNMGFLSNTGPDPLKNHKDTYEHSMLGHHRATSETPFKWRFAGGPMMAHL